MKRRGALLSLLAMHSAMAELQNIEVNGFSSINDSDRFATIAHEFTNSSNGTTLPGFRLGALTYVVNDKGERLPHSHNETEFESVSISDPQVPKQIASRVRHLFAFYARAIEPPVEKGRGLSLFVYLNNERKLVVDNLDDTWRLYLIDLWYFRNQEITVSFSVPGLALNESTARVDVGLARLVVAYGPYYAGWGGIMMIGRHGGNMLTGDFVWPTFKINPDDFSNGAMMVSWYDFVQPSSLRLISEIQNVEYRLPDGLHCVPLRLGRAPELTCRRTTLSGEIESGQVDLIPDFTGNDEERLANLEKALTQVAQVEPAAPALP